MVRLQSLLISVGCIVFVLLPAPSRGQEKCGTVEYDKIRHSKFPKLERHEAFEEWMEQKINDRKLRAYTAGHTQAATYTIPVVVHVIHNGEPVGTGTNISDAQINSQIKVLNDDYNRLNGDASKTPDEFLPFTGNLSVEFVLAKQDPEGLATTGIIRTLGTKTSWTLADNSVFKALSYWPAENYLNIWVNNFVDPAGLIGYAQLPVSSQLQGLENAVNDRLTDGVIVSYKAFGSADDGNFNLIPLYNKGRTATHEIGHFLGLRHIWGDTNCGTDYVDDTPFQAGSTTNCPTAPLASCDPDPGKPYKMYQDYMDYTADACMNLFTKGQVDRMTVILQNSPRRGKSYHFTRCKSSCGSCQ